MRQINDRNEVEYLLKGLGILGTGGGGPPREFGAPVMNADFEAGRTCSLVPMDEVADDALIISGGYLGSVADPIDVNEILRRWEEDFEFGRAVREMERYLGRKVDYLLASELGGGNTIVTITAGARMNIPVVDGDTAGRAVPESHMTSMVICDAKPTPIGMIDLENNIVFIENCGQLFADQLGRFLVTRTHGMVANVREPMDGKTLKAGVIPGTISRAIELGRFCHGLSSGSPEDNLAELAGFMDGWPLFRGVVTSLESDNTKGHYFAHVGLEGKGQYSGGRFKIVIKNETMAGWRDDQLVCMLPDILMMMKPDDLEGIMSSDIEIGTEMLIAGAPCDPILRKAAQTPAGKIAFSSERYEEKMPYQPIEALMAGK